jgi:2,4-dienoyl-CoA reductase-like NADH-dependent reductase (Old Yellow Enzyme family)
VSREVWEYEGQDDDGRYLSLSIDRNGAAGGHYFIHAHREGDGPDKVGAHIMFFLPEDVAFAMASRLVDDVALAREIRADPEVARELLRQRAAEFDRQAIAGMRERARREALPSVAGAHDAGEGDGDRGGQGEPVGPADPAH